MKRDLKNVLTSNTKQLLARRTVANTTVLMQRLRSLGAIHCHTRGCEAIWNVARCPNDRCLPGSRNTSRSVSFVHSDVWDDLFVSSMHQLCFEQSRHIVFWILVVVGPILTQICTEPILTRIGVAWKFLLCSIFVVMPLQLYKVETVRFTYMELFTRKCHLRRSTPYRRYYYSGPTEHSLSYCNVYRI